MPGLVLHPFSDNGFRHLEGAFHIGGPVLGDWLHPHRHLIRNLHQAAGSIALLLHQFVDPCRMGIQFLQVSGANLSDIIVIADDRDKAAVLRTFSVEVFLDDCVDDPVHRLGGKNSLGVIPVVVLQHRAALVEKDDQQAGRGAAPLHFVRVHNVCCY